SRGACTAMTLADIDRRALDLACRNVTGVAAATGSPISAIWTDVRTTRELPTGLDFVIMNPPFHDGATEDRTLGQAFITRAAQILRPGGQLWMTANRHLPYEATLTPLFERVETIAQSDGFKVTSARKPTKPMRDPASARVGSKVGGAFGRKSEPVTPLVIDGFVIDDDIGERRKSKRGGKDKADLRTPPRGKGADKSAGTGGRTSGGAKPVRSRSKS
ncbi:MAG: methyltransferase, partial [Hyphomicrobiaceae bacterium]|nr:methyltransferase [Hyphomicrobiaceae bacterium]